MRFRQDCEFRCRADATRPPLSATVTRRARILCIRPVNIGEVAVAARVLEVQPLIFEVTRGALGRCQPLRGEMRHVIEPDLFAIGACHSLNRDLGDVLDR